MKRTAQIVLLEQSGKVNFYSFRFEDERKTEFERFMLKFDTKGNLNADYLKVLSELQWILSHGAFERYFRPEGSIKDRVCALPLMSGRIRLYCLRFSDSILILGNGGIKKTRTYQEDEFLLGCVTDLQKIDFIISHGLEDGSFHIEGSCLNGVEGKRFAI